MRRSREVLRRVICIRVTNRREFGSNRGDARLQRIDLTRSGLMQKGYFTGIIGKLHACVINAAVGRAIVDNDQIERGGLRNNRF